LFIGGDDEYDDKGPAIDVDPSGTVWIVWTGYDPVVGDEEILYSTNDGSGWTDPDTLHGHNSSADRYPEISIGSDGVPWVVWYRAQENGSRLWFSHWEGSRWATPEILRTNAGRYDDYDIYAVNSDDVWVATDAFVDEYDGRAILIYHWDGAEWVESLRFGMEGHSCAHADIAVDPDGDPWVVWGASPEASYHLPIMYTRQTGTAWALPDTVNGDLNNSGGAEIVFDGDVPMVLWTGNMAATVEVEYSRLEDGEWTPSQLVNLPDSSTYDYDYIAECVVGPGGEVVAAWYGGDMLDPMGAAVLTSQWTGEGWTPEQIISDDVWNKTGKYPTVAIGPDSRIWSAWVCFEVIEPPWDDDIRGTSCSLLTTPVDFGLLEAATEGNTVRVSWYAAGEAAFGPFNVWRALGDGLDVMPGEPPASATRLNELSVTSPPYEWEDATAPGASELLYWVEWTHQGFSTYAGPVPVATLAPHVSAPARLLFASPNPSSSGACIGYEQSVDGVVSIAIYNIAGRRVSALVAPHRTPGIYAAPGSMLCWDGTNSSGAQVASGVYLVELRLNNAPVREQRREITILR